MGRSRHQRPGPDEVVEQGLGEGRSLGRVRAGPQLIEQDERARAGFLHDPGDGPEMARERGQGLRDRLLVTDISEHVTPDGQAAARGCRDVQAGLVHEAQQAERAQGDRLAARVRPGDDEGGVAVPQPDIDRDRPTRESRMPGRQEDDLAALGGPGPIPVHLRRQGRLGAPQVEGRERIERVAKGLAVDGDQRRQLVEDAGDLFLLRRDRFAPGIAELHGHQWLDEEGLTAPRRVVDDALDSRPRLGLHRDDVAPVAQA